MSGNLNLNIRGVYRARTQINVREYRRGNQKKDNTEKLATYGTQDEEKHNKKHNTVCVGHHFTQTNNVNKTCSFLQTTGDLRQSEHSFYAEIVTDITTRNSERKEK